MSKEVDKPQLTVAQLIEELKKFPQEALVEIDGCDCTGDATGVDSWADGRVIILREFEY
jgi:hypothetical protein